MTDFEMQLKWSCDHTWLPFLKSFCPSENYWLLKRGSEFRLCNGSYPSESTMRPTDDCTSSFIFSRQPSDADGFRLEHKMLAYDFDSDEYVDLFDKNRYHIYKKDQNLLVMLILETDLTTITGSIKQFSLLKTASSTKNSP